MDSISSVRIICCLHPYASDNSSSSSISHSSSCTDKCAALMSPFSVFFFLFFFLSHHKWLVWENYEYSRWMQKFFSDFFFSTLHIKSHSHLSHARAHVAFQFLWISRWKIENIGLNASIIIVIYNDVSVFSIPMPWLALPACTDCTR